jgi:hypothetical protein
MLELPLIRTDDDTQMTPIEKHAAGCEQMITAMMMQATLTDPTLTARECEVFTTLSVVTIIPAEA